MKKRGASLIWSVVLCGILVFVVSTMAVSTIAELKMSSRIDDSARAYAAAQSGIEYGYQFLGVCSKTNSCVTAVGTGITRNFEMTESNGTTTYEVTISKVDAQNFKVYSRGTANSVNRALEYVISAKTFSSLANLPLAEVAGSAADYASGQKYVMDNSVRVVFNYWPVSGDHTVIGFSNDATGSNSIYLKYQASDQSIILVDKRGAVETTAVVATGLSPSNVRLYQIDFSYTKGISLNATIYERDANFKPTICKGSATLDLMATGSKPDNMTNFYITSPVHSGDEISIDGGKGFIAEIFQSGLSHARKLIITINSSFSGAGTVSLLEGANIIKTCSSTCTVYLKNTSGYTISANPDSFSSITTALTPTSVSAGSSDVNASVTFSLSRPTLTLALRGSGAGQVTYSPTGDGSGTCSKSASDMEIICTIVFPGPVPPLPSVTINTSPVGADSYFAGMSDGDGNALSSPVAVANSAVIVRFEHFDTVTIGTQTWMKTNMNAGAKIQGGTAQGIANKYCYNNDERNCDKYGGLYIWNTVMQGSTTEGARGFCPVGYHVPTDNDWFVLENFLKQTGNACTSTRSNVWECFDAGSKLLSGGSSGFDAMLTGSVRVSDGSSSNIDRNVFFWTSTTNPTLSTQAMTRELYPSSNPGLVLRGVLYKTLSTYPVRCVKN